MKKDGIFRVVGVITTVFILFAGVPLVLEYLIFRNNVYSVLSNGEWGSFLGSYIGGIIGGTGTLIAMYVTTKETRKVQNENLNQFNADRSLEDKKERKQFADKIAEDVSVYITDINNYFYACRHSERLDKDRYNADMQLNGIRNNIQQQYTQQQKLSIESETEQYLLIDTEIDKLKEKEAEAIQKLQHIENEIDKNQVNRTIAIERLNILKIRLQNIPEASALIAKLEYIHSHSFSLGVEFDFMDKETRQLLDITIDFIDKYVNQRT